MDQKKTKTLIGKVVSDAMQKSRVVLVSRKIRHHLYEKVLTRSSKFMMHDENNESKMGDTVSMQYVRPLSKNKHWILDKVIEKAS